MAPDRSFRRPNPTCLIAILFAIALLCLGVARAAVFTVDLGSESLKVAVVNPRPGQSPISIAINEMSKRKSPALVAISNGDRLISEEAAGIIARYPDRVYSRTRDMVGVPIDQVKEMLKNYYLPYDVVGGDDEAFEETEDDAVASDVIREVTEKEGAEGVTSEEAKSKKRRLKRPVRIRTHDGSTEYSAEELLAMLFGYAKSLAEEHSKVGIVDAVVTVPAYFSQSQRQGIIDAGALAGVNVMALIQEHAGVALQYGMDKDFSNGSRHVAIFDMGATSTYAAVIYYSAYTTKERGKSTTVNQFQVKSIQWDADVGGQTLELRLLDHFADEFNSKHKGVDIRTSPKAMAKLKKQVKRTKEILSANSEASISVESIYDDHDFKSSITREAFEDLCSDVWPRVVAPLQAAVAEANITVDELYAVEMVGGSTRVPKVQSVLTSVFNRSLDRHLDADEALALGSSLLAANLSDGFKLNRRIGMVDGLPFAVKYKVQPMTNDGAPGGGPAAAADGAGGAVEELLFPRMKRMPLKFIRSQHALSSDFSLSFLYDEAQGRPPYWPAHTPISTLMVTGVAAVIEKYSSYNLTHPIRASLHFFLSRSGTVGLEKAELVVEFSEWVEVRRVLTTADRGNATVNSTSSNGTASGAAGNGTEGNSTATDSSSSSSSSSGASSSGYAKEDEGTDGSTGEDMGVEAANEGSDASPSPSSEVEEPKVEVTRKLRKRTIRVPLKVDDLTSGFQRLMGEEEAVEAEGRLLQLKRRDEEKRAVEEAKNTLEAYIYSMKDKLDSDDDLLRVTTQQQRDKLRNKLVEVEDWLYLDGEHAPAAEFKTKLGELRGTGDAFVFRKSELTARPAAVGVGRSFVEATYDLLESWRTDKPWVNASTEIEPVLADVEALSKWLDSMTSAQAKLKAHEAPIFSSKDVYSQVDKIEAKLARIRRIPKPKPKKVSPPPAAAGGNNTANSTSTNTTADSSSSTPSGGKGEREAGDVRDEL